MDSLKESSKYVAQTSERFLTANKKYYELKIFQQIAVATTSFSKIIVIGSLMGLGLIFLSFSAAFALGEYWNSTNLGFLAVGGSYVLIAIGSFILRNRLEQVIIQKLSKTFFD
ncbi:phage holin family protein [Flagellimonas sp. 389]|uniref:phage holin family protein n=1 Tax=Flagellimonas sp. 389 TaxID=2835862 RepID=UPI001BD4FDED|nr:phage holin family protein [Flagellimonas sp. 389]MBS9463239.1 phage holin family protein [Flagellimonas sp. 389]